MNKPCSLVINTETFVSYVTSKLSSEKFEEAQRQVAFLQKTLGLCLNEPVSRTSLRIPAFFILYLLQVC
jgi:hypothetical protein